MTRFFTFLFSLILLLTMAGCDQFNTTAPTGGLAEETTPTDAQGETLPKPAEEIALCYDVTDALNPFAATGYTNRALFSLVYQGLFAVDRNYEVRPILCNRYNLSADKKTYTFYLASATYSDGTAVTAEDVVASLKAATKSTWYGNRLQHVTSITSYGDAVVLELDIPMENLPILLDIPILKSTEIQAEIPLGTGPYICTGEVLRRQVGWWCNVDLPIEEEVIPLLRCETAAEMRDGFEFSNVAMVCTNPSDHNSVDFHSDYELWDCETGLFLYLGVNADSAVFSDPDLRRALTHAIDRDTLVQEYYGSFAYAASLPISPQSPYYSTALANTYAYAPEKFSQALENADITQRTLTLLLNGDEPLRLTVGNAIAAMLEKYGFTVEIVQATSENFVTLLKKGNYDLYLAQTKLSANMDLTTFFTSGTGLNYGGLADPATYAICLEALTDSDNYFTLCETVMNNGQLCPILFQTAAVYTCRNVFTDFSPARDNIFYYDLGRTLSDALISE